MYMQKMKLLRPKKVIFQKYKGSPESKQVLLYQTMNF